MVSKILYVETIVLHFVVEVKSRISYKRSCAKKIKPGCGPCRRKCTDKINEVDRVEIFNNYWNENKSWDLKLQLTISRVKCSRSKRKRSADSIRGNKRKQTIQYTFEINGKIIEVLK